MGGCEFKRMTLIFKTEMKINRSKYNLDEKILFGKITRHCDQEIRKIPARVCLGTRIPHSILVRNLLAIEIKILLLKLTM